ncbi:hypothetical protein [Pseudanabaena sp. 'Roaring Creek']|uniref:hypothetical protein n=1 Tax=Pseudanabaena sp. 'Roaring Creek' TaxID=1681830 RepID=UPI000B091ABE|nr:hypothetical protein [Pseudanabaena sp. 'Roaring Creek']
MSATSSNALEILITARDDASKQLSVISNGIGDVGKQSILATTGITNFGASLVKAADGTVATKLQQISGAIIDIGQKSPSALLATATGFISVVGAIQNSSIAIAAFQGVIVSLESGLIDAKASLVDIKDSLIDVGKVFGGLDLQSSATKNLVTTIKAIEEVATNPTIIKASEVIKGFLNDLSFNAGQNTGKAFQTLFNLFDEISATAKATAEKVQSFFAGITFFEDAKNSISEQLGNIDLTKLKDQIDSTFSNAKSFLDEQLEKVDFSAFKDRFDSTIEDVGVFLKEQLGKVDGSGLRGNFESAIATIGSYLNDQLGKVDLTGLKESAEEAFNTATVFFDEQLSKIDLTGLKESAEGAFSSAKAFLDEQLSEVDFTGLKQGFESVLASVQSSANSKSIASVFEQVSPQLQKIASNISTTLGPAIAPVFEGINKGLSEASGEVAKFLSNSGVLTTTEVTKIQSELKNLGSNTIEVFDQIFSRFFQGVGTEAKTNLKVVETEVTAVLETSLGQKFAKAGIDYGQKLASGIESAVNGGLKGVDAILNAVEKRANALRNVRETSGFIQQATLTPANIPGAEAFGKLKEESTKLLTSLSNVGQELLFLTYGVQQLTSAFSAPFDIFIGQNIRLQATLLSTQAQIVSTNKVFKNGLEVTSATEAIQSLGAVSKRTITDIQEGALKLVGLVSTDLVDQILPAVTQNLSQLGGKLGDVPKLVTSLGAALGTLGIPLFEARESLSLIASGTVTVENRLARSLSITNQQVNLWKSQGSLIDNLTKRLQPFVEGNALAAQTIGGVTSNLKEVFQLLTQRAGETFLDVVVQRLNVVYKLVDITTVEGRKNFEDLQGIVAGVAKNIFDGFVKFGDGVAALFKAIAPAIAGFIQVGAKTIGDLLSFVGDTLKTLADGPLKYLFAALGALSQFADVFTGIFKIGLFLKIREVILGLAIGGIGLLIQTLPVVSTLFGLFSLRSNGAVLALTNLRGASNTTVASILTLGKNINVIPGALQAVSKAVPFLGASLSTLIPQFSQIGIAAIALGEKFPFIGAIFESLDTAIPKLIAGFARLAIAALETADAFVGAGGALGVFAEFATSFNTEPIIAGLTKLTTITKLSETGLNSFGKSVGGLRSTIITSLGSFAFSALLFAGAFQLFEKFQPVFEEIGKAAAEAFGQLVFLAKVVVEGLKSPLALVVTLGTAITFLAFAISNDLITVIGRVIALQFVGYLQAIAGALSFLAGAEGTAKVAAAIEAMSVTGVGSLAKLKIAFVELVPVILTALAPLLLIIAALGTIAIKANEFKQEDEINADNASTGQAEQADNKTFSLLGRSKKSKAISDKAAGSGVKLSKEQYADNAKLQKEIEEQINSETVRKAGLEEGLNGISTSTERDNQNKKIKDATDNIDRLKKSVEGVETSAKDLPKYGSAVEQFTRNVDNAKKSLINASGDPAIFKQQINTLLEGSQQLQDMGAITVEDAVKTYKEIASNTSADAETQIKAQQAITAAYKLESQKRIATYDTQIAKTSALVAQGRISESEAIALTSKANLDKLKEEEEAISKSYKARAEIIDSNTKNAVDSAKQDRLIADAKLAAAQGDPTKLADIKAQQLKGVDDKKQAVEDDLNKAKAELAKLEENNALGSRTGESTAAIDEAHVKVQRLQNQFEKLATFRGTLDSTIKIDADVLKDVKELPSQIEEAQAKLAELKKGRDSKKANLDKENFFSSPQDRKVAKVKLKEDDDAVNEQEGVVNALQSRFTKAQKATTPDKENEKAALSEKQSAIDAENKAVANGQKVKTEAQLAADSELQQKRAAIAQKIAEDQIKILDSQIKTAGEVQKVGETQRLGEIAKLRKRGVILESEAKLQETGEKKKEIDLELSLEQQKLIKFNELDKKGIGVSQEVRRASVLKIAELTKQQTEIELAAIDGLVAAIKDRLTLAAQQYGITIEKQNLKLEKQKLLYTALERTLANQDRLAQSSKKLNDSVVAVHESDLNVLTKIYDKQQQAIRDAGGTGNSADKELEEKKLLLAEQLAKIKLESLLRQQVFERESLERDIQKRDLLLERQKLENQINIAKKKIDLATGEVGIKTAEEEVKLKPESAEAKLKLARAKLDQQKNELEYGGLVQESGFLNETGRLNKEQNGQERETLQNNQFAQRTTANAEFASALTDPALQQQLLQQIEVQTKQRAFGVQGQTRITGDQARALINAPIPDVRGASLSDPSKYGEVLKRSESNPNGTLTTEAPKPKDNSFATSFEELQQKYPDKVGNIDDLNKKYGGKDATTFEELNAKYSGKPADNADPTAKIGSSFDRLNKQIDEGFTKVLIAPQLKVDEMTSGLEAQFNKITTQIKDNPITISLDNSALDKAKAELDKPLKVIDEDQLKRLEGILGALSQGGSNLDIKTAGVNAAGAGTTTINAPITVNNPQNGASNAQDIPKAVSNALDSVLKRVANIVSSTK